MRLRIIVLLVALLPSPIFAVALDFRAEAAPVIVSGEKNQHQDYLVLMVEINLLGFLMMIANDDFATNLNKSALDKIIDPDSDENNLAYSLSSAVVDETGMGFWISSVSETLEKNPAILARHLWQVVEQKLPLIHEVVSNIMKIYGKNLKTIKDTERYDKAFHYVQSLSIAN